MLILLMILFIAWGVWGAWEFMTVGKKPKVFIDFVRLGPVFWIIEFIKIYKKS